MATRHFRDRPGQQPQGWPGGERIDNALRRTMESRFGEDFRNVRVHSNQAANMAALSHGAAALTRGADPAVSDKSVRSMLLDPPI